MPRQRATLLFGMGFRNFKAYLAYCKRLGIPLPSEREHLAAA